MTYLGQPHGEIIIYRRDDSGPRVEVRIEQGTVWLDVLHLSALYGIDRSGILRHIKNIYSDGELEEATTSRSISGHRMEGTREVVREAMMYNLDMIIALGYRVNSPQAILFRKWATEILKEYAVKGFALNDEQLKELGGGSYWHELLERIRDIRSSEKVFYRQVLDLYATSIDYDPGSTESRRFFKVVQNKLHYAAHGRTASEVLYTRADAERNFMGLRTFRGPHPTLADARIAKNYLDEKELKVLNNLVSAYFDFAEVHAMNHEHLRMVDHLRHLDSLLTANGQPLLQGSGSVSHADAMKKVETEYRKFQARTLTPVENAYLDSICFLKKETKSLPRRSPKKNAAPGR